MTEKPSIEQPASIPKPVFERTIANLTNRDQYDTIQERVSYTLLRCPENEVNLLPELQILQVAKFAGNLAALLIAREILTESELEKLLFESLG